MRKKIVGVLLILIAVSAAVTPLAIMTSWSTLLKAFGFTILIVLALAGFFSLIWLGVSYLCD